MQNKNKVTALALLASLLSSAPAKAVVLEYSFETTLRAIGITGLEYSAEAAAMLETVGIGVDVPASGYLRVDETEFVVDARLEVGSLSLPLVPNSGLNVANVIDGGTDIFIATFQSLAIAPISFSTVGIQLRDSTGTAFDTDALPTALDLDDFDPFVLNSSSSTNFLWAAVVNGESGIIQGELTQIGVRVVPLPGAVWLLAGACACLVARPWCYSPTD